MRTNFDPPYPPDEPEGEPATGDFVCLHCGRRSRVNREYLFCVCGKRMEFRPDSKSDKAVYCDICQDWIEPSEFKRWTGDDQLHYLCPGCDSDMVEPKDAVKDEHCFDG